MKNKLATILALFAFIPANAYAQSSSQNKEITGFVAGGVLAAPDYEGSDDFEVLPLGYARINYQHYYLETNGPGFDINVSPLTTLEFGPSFRYRGDRDDIESNKVDRLDNIDEAYEAGAFAKIPFRNIGGNRDELSFGLRYLADISGTHEGHVVSGSATYGFMASDKLRLTTSLSADYVSDDYNETYFGISNAEAIRSGLSAYSAEGGFHSYGGTVIANYSLTQTWSISVLGSYDRLTGDAADSPVTDDEGSPNQYMAGVGLGYRF